MDTIKRNPSSSITAFFAAIALLPPFVNEFRDAAAPLGVDPAVWLIVSAVLAGGVVVGQMWQAIAEFTVGVTWGAPSVFGFIVAAATGVAPFVADLAGALDPLGVPNTVWVAVSAGLTLVTLFGRVWQAVAPGRQTPPVVITEPVPEEGGAGEPLPA